MVFVKSLFHVAMVFGPLWPHQTMHGMSNFAKIHRLCTRKCFNSYHFSSEMPIIVHFIYGGDILCNFFFSSALLRCSLCLPTMLSRSVIYYYFYSAFKVVNLLKLLNVSDKLGKGKPHTEQKNNNDEAKKKKNNNNTLLTCSHNGTLELK